MATLRLPTFRANLDHQYNITLDGETFTLEFHFNARANRWNMSIFDAENNAVRHGIRLVIGFDLLRLVALATKPQGTLTMVDTTGADIEPDSATFGVETQLRYTEALS